MRITGADPGLQARGKKILGVKTSTPNSMVYGEPGRYPMELQIKIKMLCFWNNCG
jgi:hypothetical protein